MNAKTSKMLNKLALLLNVPKREVKKRWHSQPWMERAKARDQIWGLIAKNHDTIASRDRDKLQVKEKARQRFLKLTAPHRRNRTNLAAVLAFIGGLFNGFRSSKSGA